MIDEKKIAQYNMEMAEHANGVVQYLNVMIGGRFVTWEQVSVMADYVLAQTKRNIESFPLPLKKKKTQRIVLGRF